MNNLDPGRELDALIAEKVMDWKEVRFIGQSFSLKPDNLEGRPPDYEKYEQAVIRKCLVPIPNYSTDIAAAWLIIEEFKKREAAYCIEQHPCAEEPTVWILTDKNMPEGMVATDHQEHISATAATVPLAICLAALKAIAKH